MEKDKIAVNGSQSIIDCLSDYFGLEPTPFDELATGKSNDKDVVQVQVTIEREGTQHGRETKV